MKPEQIALFTNSVLAEASGRFGIDKASLKRLDGFENMVLEASRDGLPCILRLLDEWSTRYRGERRERIINETPVLNLDWKAYRVRS